jgi:hypothetical protein
MALINKIRQLGDTEGGNCRMVPTFKKTTYFGFLNTGRSNAYCAAAHAGIVTLYTHSYEFRNIGRNKTAKRS